MSGTVGYTNKVAEEVRLKAIEQQELVVNQESVKNLLLAIVKSAAGWSQIEPEFQRIIESSLAGVKIDINTLNTMITEWKGRQ